MSSVDTSPRDVKAIIERYRAIGLYGGTFLGAVVGVMVVGPNLSEWSGARSLLTIFGSIALGGLVGYIAGEIAVASITSGSGPGLGGGTGEDGVGGDAGGDGGGDS